MSEHAIEIRVRYEETDQMGVAYYANYLVWFEVARTEFFRAKGIVYRQIEEKDKVFLPVVEAHCRYRSPLRYDDLATITTKIAETGNSRISFDYEVKKGENIVATGKTKHAFINENGKPVPVPAKVKKALLG
jgi:acyl-CoA thioester hydrolase